MMRRRWVLVAVVALVAASCGGGGDDPDAVAQAIADGMMEEAGDDVPFTRDQAECFGEEVVDRMGVDRLAEVGLSLEDIENGADPASVDLSSDDINDMTDSLSECINFGELVVGEFAGDMNLSDESAQCIVDGINDGDLLGTIAETSLFSDDIDAAVEAEMTQMMFGLFTECLTADELMNLGG